MSATWIVPELQEDFPNDFDIMVADYIATKYNITDPDKLDTKHFNIKNGFFDYSKPYEIAVIESDTRIEQWLSSYNPYVSTGIEIGIRMKRISRDKVDPQMGNMEREIIRIAGQYRPNDLPGIKYMPWDGGSRFYNLTDSWAMANWVSAVRVRLYYEKKNIAPP